MLSMPEIMEVRSSLWKYNFEQKPSSQLIEEVCAKAASVEDAVSSIVTRAHIMSKDAAAALEAQSMYRFEKPRLDYGLNPPDNGPDKPVPKFIEPRFKPEPQGMEKNGKRVFNREDLDFIDKPTPKHLQLSSKE